MLALAEPRRWRAVSYLGSAVLVAAGIGGCTSDVARFNDSALSSPYAARSAAPAPDVTGTASRPALSASRVETQQLPPPPQASTQGGSSVNAAAGRADITGSVQPTAAAAPARSNWNWEGGTAITVGRGDSIDSLSKRYGVPASAIMQANNITAPASIQPGQRLVIPRYNYYSGAQNPRAPATRVAANATMVPTGATSRAAIPPTPPSAGNAVHVVAKGDSLISIARRYHKPRKAIAKANNLALDAKIRIGQHLTIPGVKAPASPAVVTNPVAKTPPAAPVLRRTADATPAVKPSAPPQASAAPGSKPVGGTAGGNAHVAAPAAEPVADASGGAAPAETTGSNPTFRWPVRGRIIAGYGPKTNGQQNDGINLSVPEGTSVKAAEDGVVAYAGNELKGYGNLVLVRHGNGFVTAYAHASELMVKRGDQVKRGQVIMRSGQTGSVTSPQLHFEIRKGASPVDPTQYLSGT